MRKSGYEEKVVTLVTLSHNSGHFPLIFHSFALPLQQLKTSIEL